MMPSITIREFFISLNGVKELESRVGNYLRMEDWHWESFAFDDLGAHWIRHDPRYYWADSNRQAYLQIKGGAVEIPAWIQ